MFVKLQKFGLSTRIQDWIPIRFSLFDEIIDRKQKIFN